MDALGSGRKERREQPGCTQAWKGSEAGPGWGQPQVHLFCLHLRVPSALLCFDHQLREVKEAKGQAPSEFSPQEAEIMKSFQ